ncbi:MAG: hypothetical protein ACPHXR_03810, partial [Flavicella sp.]
EWVTTGLSFGEVWNNYHDFMSEYFVSKSDAYNYVKEQVQLPWGGTREVSGFALNNGHYIVLDASNNTRTSSDNNRLKTFFNENNEWSVMYMGESYTIKYHFHTHPPTIGRCDPIGVSQKDLQLRNRFNKPIRILHKGIEWEVGSGNDYINGKYHYSLTNKGIW